MLQFVNEPPPPAVIALMHLQTILKKTSGQIVADFNNCPQCATKDFLNDFGPKLIALEMELSAHLDKIAE